MQTFDHEDLLTAVSYSKDAMHVASLLRKPTNMINSIRRLVRGTGQPASAMHGMTLVQRHAELVFAESTLLKSVMGILLSGDMFAFVSEALSLRSVYGMYRSLADYIAWLDDPTHATEGEVDEDFRSGVYLGNGSISLVFGLLPGKVLMFAELFGYTGSCADGLAILLRAGRWRRTRPLTLASVEPSAPAPAIGSGFPPDEEGIRRPVCDMAVLTYHLVISTFMPVQGTDIPLAQAVLWHYLARYPRGVFFLYFLGRLHSCIAEPGLAIEQFARARDVQRDIVQLRALSIFEMALSSMSLCDWASAAGYFQSLLAESSWSPAVYSYGMGAAIYSACEAQASGDELVAADVGPAHDPGVREPAAFLGGSGAPADTEASRAKAVELMFDAPGRMQRIAGKSIPLEKFVAKKAAKLADQGYLLLPALELSYVFHCLTHAPARSLRAVHLPLVARAITQLAPYANNPAAYRSGTHGWRADWCLAHFLHGVINGYIAYPDAHHTREGEPVLRPNFSSKSSSSHTCGLPFDPNSDPDSNLNSDPTSDADVDANADADAAAEASLVFATQVGRDLTSDQYLVYFAHLELGRLLASRGNTAGARAHLGLLLSNTSLDRAPRKGKYALQNMCLLRAHGALTCLPPPPKQPTPPSTCAS